MKSGAHIVAAAAARFYTPLILLFAALLLFGAPPGGGIGLVAGLAFGLALILHALVFGAAAARSAIPTSFAVLLLALGGMAALASAGLHGFSHALPVIEAGVFSATAATAALVIQVVFARVPTLRDEDL